MGDLEISICIANKMHASLTAIKSGSESRAAIKKRVHNLEIRRSEAEAAKRKLAAELEQAILKREPLFLRANHLWSSHQRLSLHAKSFAESPTEEILWWRSVLSKLSYTASKLCNFFANAVQNWIATPPKWSEEWNCCHARSMAYRDHCVQGKAIAQKLQMTPSQASEAAGRHRIASELQKMHQKISSRAAALAQEIAMLKTSQVQPKLHVIRKPWQGLRHKLGKQDEMKS